MYEDHKDQFHIKTDVEAACFEAKTQAEYTPFSFSTANNVSLTGFSAKGTDTTLNGLKPFGLGGEYGLDERVGVLEAGASGSISPTDPGLKGEAHVGAIVGEGVLRGTAGVYPSRWVEGLCNMTDGRGSNISSVLELCNEVSQHDYGIAFSGKVGATLGWAASGEVHGQLKDGRVDAGWSQKLAPGVGTIIGASIQMGRVDR